MTVTRVMVTLSNRTVGKGMNVIRDKQRCQQKSERQKSTVYIS